jgi:hypothetical protein
MKIGSRAALGAAGVAFMISQAGPAAAWHYGHGHYGGAEGLIGGVVGGIIGGAIAGSANKAQEQPKTQEKVIVRERAVQQPSVNSYEREQNRNVQNALNYFGYPVGAPDGVLGRKSRSAISEYQATLGFPVTGYLSEYERSFLLSSHARAQANEVQTAQLVQQMGMGQRGVLVAYRTNQTAGAVMNVQQPPIVVQQPAAPVAVAAPGPQPAPPQVVINTGVPQQQEAPAAEPEVKSAAAMMPNFIGGPVEASMASFCNKTSLLTASSGGMVTAASLTDPAVAVGEQFCLARTYAIDEGERLTAQVQGVTLAQMQEQCAAFAPTMRDYVASVVAKDPEDATSDLQSFVIKSGMSPAQLSANAKICLSIGYRTDSADVAMASALVLVGLGEAAYGEMLGHHLAQGFGAPKRLDRAADWYDSTVSAIEGGAQRVVAPGASDRPALLRAAAVKLRGGQAPAAAAPQQAVLPSFGMPGAPKVQEASN